MSSRKYTLTSVLLVSFTVCFILLSLSSCRNKPASSSSIPDTKTEWQSRSFDFGDITEGETVTHSFYFKNIGEQNFVIKNIDSGCGCTTANYDKAPVKAGKEGKIEIAFNSSGRYGKQYKEISIFANVPEKSIILTIIANVK